jgi:hypothetical protein
MESELEELRPLPGRWARGTEAQTGLQLRGRYLDLETLVCTRGRDFPIAHIADRLRCTRCGCRRVGVMFGPPKIPVSSAAAAMRTATPGITQSASPRSREPSSHGSLLPGTSRLPTFVLSRCTLFLDGLALRYQRPSAL